MKAVSVAPSRVRLRDLVEITKPRLSGLVLISAGIGMILAPGVFPAWSTALAALLGTALVVGGANALNCYLERESDGLMKRTRNRPLPAGRLDATVALVFGTLIALAGTVLLWAIQPLAGLLAIAAILSYVFVYTPMKRRTWLCTAIGAVPGAIPPLIGWAVATGSLSLGAWLLFTWLFLWQHPHFFALAFLYEDDYRAAGMPMFSVKLGRNSMVEKQMLLFTLMLAPIPLLLVPLTRAGTLTLFLSPILGLAYVAVVLRELIKGTTDQTARHSFSASVVYLGLVFLVMLIDAGISGIAGLNS